MAILRPLVAGTLAAARPMVFRQANPRLTALAARRLLSTSSRVQAQPVQPFRSQSPDYLPEPKKPRSPSINTPFPGEYTNPYKGGPSAIEKAVHLFFFTEILRGEFECAAGHERIIQSFFLASARNVDRTRAILPTTIHYHVPIREGAPLPTLPRRACSAQIPQRRGTVYW